MRDDDFTRTPEDAARYERWRGEHEHEHDDDRPGPYELAEEEWMAAQERAAQVNRLIAEQKQAAVRRRERVLAHPEIAARLTRAPFKFKRPEDWSGYLPAKTNQTIAGEKPNPAWEAFCEILRAVLEAEASDDA